jgi:hypothetical protein
MRIKTTFSNRLLPLAAALLLSAGCQNEQGQPEGKPGGAGPAASGQPKAADDKRPEPPQEADTGNAPEQEDPLAGLDPKVVRAVELAEDIESDPEAADDVLARAELDREGLDALMYEIALEPELAAQYRIARGLQEPGAPPDSPPG